MRKAGERQRDVVGTGSAVAREHCSSRRPPAGPVATSHPPSCRTVTPRAARHIELPHRSSANSQRTPPRRLAAASTLPKKPGGTAGERANRVEPTNRTRKTGIAAVEAAARPGEAASKAQPVHAGPRMPAPPHLSPHSSRHTPLHRSRLLCYYVWTLQRAPGETDRQ
jgi:hypothetical protein